MDWALGWFSGNFTEEKGKERTGNWSGKGGDEPRRINFPLYAFQGRFYMSGLWLAFATFIVTHSAFLSITEGGRLPRSTISGYVNGI